MYWLRASSFLGLVAFFYILFGRDEAAAEWVLALLTILLNVFVLNEIRLGRRSGVRVTSYVVLTSLWVFIACHGVANYIYYLPEPVQFDLLINNPGFDLLARFQALVCIAAVGLWGGFRSPFGHRLGMSLDAMPRLMAQLRWDFESINWGVVLGVVAFSYVARLLAFSLGVYGYSGDVERMLALAAYTQYITYAGQLGMVALLAVAVHHMGSSNPNRRWQSAVWVLMVGEILWGFLAGFKNMVIMPLVVVIIVATIIKGRVPRRLPFVAVGLLLLAYAIIEPYREARYSDASLATQDVEAVASTMYGLAQAGGDTAPSDTEPGTVYKVMTRVAMTEMGARAVQYKDDTGIQPGDPPFLQNLLLGPAYAFIPRVLWPSKPMANTGSWFTKVLTGQEFVYSSTDMTPIAYMYFGGGVLLVFAGFFVIGVVQRTYESALSRAGPGTAILGIGLMSTLVVMTSEVWSVIGMSLQMTIGLYFLQSRLFYR